MALIRLRNGKRKTGTASANRKNSFEAISREWHANKADRWTVAYRDEIIKTFEQDVFPFIGKRPIGEIKPLELLEVLRRIEKRGALEKTRKVRQRCGEVFRYAIITGRAEYNPAPDLAIALAVPKQKHHLFYLPKNYLILSEILKPIPAASSPKMPLK